jgi:hypothetical protein
MSNGGSHEELCLFPFQTLSLAHLGSTDATSPCCPNMLHVFPSRIYQRSPSLLAMQIYGRPLHRCGVYMKRSYGEAEIIIASREPFMQLQDQSPLIPPHPGPLDHFRDSVCILR